MDVRHKEVLNGFLLNCFDDQELIKYTSNNFFRECKANKFVRGLRENNWQCKEQEQKNLFHQHVLEGKLIINAKEFIFSTHDGDLAFQVERFVQEELFDNDPEKMKSGFELLYTSYHSAFEHIFITSYLTQCKTIIHLTKEKKQFDLKKAYFYLEIVSYDFFTKTHKPLQGIATAVFILKAEGYQWLSAEFSNSKLRDSWKVGAKNNNDAFSNEIDKLNTTSHARLEKHCKWIAREAMVLQQAGVKNYLSEHNIVAFAKKLLVNPLDRAHLLAFKKLKNSLIIPSDCPPELMHRMECLIEECDYLQALNALNKEIANEHTPKNLKQLAEQVLDAVEYTKLNIKTTTASSMELIKFMHTMQALLEKRRELIKHFPLSASAAEQDGAEEMADPEHLKDWFEKKAQYEQVFLQFQQQAQTITQRPWGKLLGGLALILLGTLIITGCIIFSYLSAGGMIPLAFGGGKLALYLMLSGCLILSTLGIIPAIKGNILFFKTAKKNPPLELRKQSGRFEKEAKQKAPRLAC